VREAYLHAIARELAGREAGPGLIYRVARELQPRFIAPAPVATGSRSSIGKSAR
jgi:hypothetical protein